jgi:hypothetical protein
VPKLDAKLNDRQLALLQRILDGSAPVTSGEPELATSVYALRNGRLVTLERQGGRRWQATITDRDGRAESDSYVPLGSGRPRSG